MKWYGKFGLLFLLTFLIFLLFSLEIKDFAILLTVLLYIEFRIMRKI